MRRAVFLVFVAACGGEDKTNPGPDAFACDPAAADVVHPITSSPMTDEDGSLFVGPDGNAYLAFISNRRGLFETYVTHTVAEPFWDGATWSEPQRVIDMPATENLLNFVTQTKDGAYHLTGRNGTSTAATTGHVSSMDLTSWSALSKYDPTTPMMFTAGALQENPVTGDYWLVFLSPTGGDYNLYIQKSTNQGASWSTPVRLTPSPENDFVFSFRITPAGKFVIAWECYAANEAANPPYFGSSSNVYLLTSNDGATWNPEILLTNDGATPQLDALPWLHEDPNGNLWVSWITTRIDTQGKTFAAVMIQVTPTLVVTNVKRLPVDGYSIRSARLPDGRYILAWVRDQDPSTTATNYDYEYRVLCDWSFPNAQ